MGAMPETGKAIAPMGRSCGSSPRGFPRRPHLRVACACGTPACHRGNDMYGIRLLCVLLACSLAPAAARSEEHTSELQYLMRISYAVFCLKKKSKKQPE